MTREELKYAALLLGTIGGLCALFLLRSMVTMMMVIGFGLFFIFIEALSLSYAVYKDHKGEPIMEAIGAIAKLTFITMVAAATLTTTYESTQAYMASHLETILPQIMPEATNFRPVIGGSGEVVYYEAYDDAGKLVGYAFFVKKEGFKGPILIAGAIDLDYKVTAIKVVRQQETAGLGARIREPGFQHQFIGASVEDLHLSPEGKIDAITGATISSQAVTDAMRNKIENIQLEVEK
jgi:electron transport complex protein RnfG